jgi:hypothetical protein
MMADKMRKDMHGAYKQCHDMRSICFGPSFPTTVEVATTMATLRM